MASDDNGIDGTSAAIRKAERLLAFILSTTIDDCLVSEASGKLLSIKGLETSKITCEMLRKFCSIHCITGYKSLNKVKITELIVERCRSDRVGAAYYPEDHLDENEGNEDDEESKEEAENGVNNTSRDDSAIDGETFEWDDAGCVGVRAAGVDEPNNDDDNLQLQLVFALSQVLLL